MFGQADRQRPLGTYDSYLNHERTALIHPNMFYQHGVINIAVTSCIAFIAVLSNLYLIAYIARTKATRICKNTCYGYYLLHLCMVEIIISGMSVPFTLVVNSENLVEYGKLICRIGFVMKRLLCSICHTTIAAMVIQRFLCLNNSMRKRRSIVHLKISLLVSWCWAIVNLLPQIILYSTEDITNNIKDSSVNVTVLIVSTLFIPFVMILYSRVGLSSLKSAESALLIKRCRQYRKFSCTCLIFSCVLVATNLPGYIVELLIELRNENKIQMNVTKETLAATVTFSWIYLPAIPITYYLTHIMVRIRREPKNVPEIVTHNTTTTTNTNNINNTFLTFNTPETNKMFALSPLASLASRTSLAITPTYRRRSLFDRRKSNGSLDGVLDEYSRRFSEPHVNVNAELINSCLTSLEAIYEKHNKKKSFFKNTFRRLSSVLIEQDDESDVPSSQELTPFPHVVHKLNQRQNSRVQQSDKTYMIKINDME